MRMPIPPTSSVHIIIIISILISDMTHKSMVNPSHSDPSESSTRSRSFLCFLPIIVNISTPILLPLLATRPLKAHVTLMVTLPTSHRRPHLTDRYITSLIYCTGCFYQRIHYLAPCQYAYVGEKHNIVDCVKFIDCDLMYKLSHFNLNGESITMIIAIEI